MIGLESIKDMHMIHCKCPNRAQQWLTAMCLPFSASSEGRIRNLGLFWDHFGTLVPFGTKSQNWDLFGAPEQRWTENPSQYYSYNNSNRSLLLLEAAKYFLSTYILFWFSPARIWCHQIMESRTDSKQLYFSCKQCRKVWSKGNIEN